MLALLVFIVLSTSLGIYKLLKIRGFTMDFSRKAREHATERGYTVSYSMKSDRSIENDILDERIRQPAMGLG